MEYYAAMLEKSMEGIHDHMAKFKKLQDVEQLLGDGEDAKRIIRGAKWLVSENITTITSEKWRIKFKVSFETARQDLTKLEATGLVRKRTEGRKNFFDLV